MCAFGRPNPVAPRLFFPIIRSERCLTLGGMVLLCSMDADDLYAIACIVKTGIVITGTVIDVSG